MRKRHQCPRTPPGTSRSTIRCRLKQWHRLLVRLTKEDRRTLGLHASRLPWDLDEGHRRARSTLPVAYWTRLHLTKPVGCAQRGHRGCNLRPPRMQSAAPCVPCKRGHGARSPGPACRRRRPACTRRPSAGKQARAPEAERANKLKRARSIRMNVMVPSDAEKNLRRVGWANPELDLRQAASGNPRLRPRG